MPEEVIVEQVTETPEVEEKVEVAQEAAETETPAQDDKQEQPRDEKGKFKPGVQTRIDELTRARHEAEREAAYWKQRATPEKTPEPAAKPTMDKFNDVSEYVEAMAEWKADQKVAEALKARDAEAEKSAQARVVQTQEQVFAERMSKTKESIPDFDAVVGAADIPISSHVQESILESDKGPELVYHFAKNPQEAARISALSPLAAAREIGRIEAGLSNQPSPKPSSKAPVPMKPTGGGATAVSDPAKMSMDEYKAYRQKQGARY